MYGYGTLFEHDLNLKCEYTKFKYIYKIFNRKNFQNTEMLQKRGTLVRSYESYQYIDL